MDQGSFPHFVPSLQETRVLLEVQDAHCARHNSASLWPDLGHVGEGVCAGVGERGRRGAPSTGMADIMHQVSVKA